MQPEIRTGRFRSKRASSNRMDSLFIRYHRSAKDGFAHVVEPSRSYRKRKQNLCSVEHFLRHSPLWRFADFSSRAPWRRIVGAVELSRVDGRLSGQGRRTRSNPYLRDPVSLASRAHESVGSQDGAAIRSFIGRDCRPSNLGRSSGPLSGCQDSACICFDGGRRGVRGRRWPRGLPCQFDRAAKRQRRNEDRRWLAEYPLSPKRDPLSRQRE